MDEQKLMKFLQKILDGKHDGVNGFNAALRLEQLKKILQEQHISEDLIQHVDIAIQNLPEAMDIAMSSGISKERLKFAEQRGEERRRREMEMNYRGCR